MARLHNTFYQNDGGYNDGDSVEQNLLALVEQGVTVDTLPKGSDDFATVYHLSHIRENILNWYPFRPGATGLEIGAGCGAITGLLCDRLESVTSVELTMQRASVIAARHKARTNLDIYVGNFGNMEFPERFDYIILNGVFEYAGSFIQGSKPYKTFLQLVRGHLKPDGVLLIAIENRLGLKYFNGIGEDHTGRLFDGLDGYKDTTSVRTFSQAELEALLREAGLAHSRFYYPYPDYKFPTEIFSAASVSTMDFGKAYPNYNLDRLNLFDEPEVARTLAAQGVAQYFANSFLAEVSAAPLQSEEVHYVKHSNDRAPAFRMMTKILAEDGVRHVVKQSLDVRADAHIQAMGEADKYNDGALRYLKGEAFAGAAGRGSAVVYPFLKTGTLQSHLLQLAKSEGQEAMLQALDAFFALAYAGPVAQEDYNTPAFQRVFGDRVLPGAQPCVSPANIDLLFENVFLEDDGYVVIDPEWMLPFPVPVQFMQWRSIWALYEANSWLEEYIPVEALYTHYGITTEKYDCYVDWMIHFTQRYAGTGSMLRLQKRVYPVNLNGVLQNEVDRHWIYSSLYVDEGKGFPTQPLTCNVMLDGNGGFTVRFDLSGCKGVKALRWHVAHGRFVQCALTNVQGNCSIAFEPIEGKLQRDGFTRFYTRSAAYLAKGCFTSLGEVVLSGFLRYPSEQEALISTEEEYRAHEATQRALTSEVTGLQTQLEQVERHRHILENYSGALRAEIELASANNQRLMASRMFRLVHFFSRLKVQLLQGNLAQKKAFFSWLRHGGDGTATEYYQPLLSVQHVLDTALRLEQGPLTGGQESIFLMAVPPAERSFGLLYQKYDVIVLSVIDYGFRFQRPQHFAQRYAENGHRTFYINANFHGADAVCKLAENLYEVTLHSDGADAIYYTDWQGQMDEIAQKMENLLYRFNIRDAVVKIDYPNWTYVAQHLRQRYGFKLVVDYMDDYTGFLNEATDMLRDNCENLLRESDGVVASSQFLSDIVTRYNENTTIIRNGTEYAHFEIAASGAEKKERPVIGYYGAVAEWFDAKKVCFLAENLPNCDVVIVGAVTENEELLKAQPNIRLLGEKPYAELPTYLAGFDVCLIPFDTTTDLIKATNPVKFYEYLSAGKKIVATEIPELEPFRDEYVYLSNDNETFLQYVKLCLAGEDTLRGPEDCMRLGLENDWQQRYEAFAAFCHATVPMASIVVLCYNNLAYNKLCIESILQKTAYPDYELVVVDNGSTDGTREYLGDLDKQGIPNLKVVLSGENLGFAGGNNLGIQHCSGEYVVLLNNDTIVTRGWLTALVKHMENDKGLGMCGAVTNSIGNEGKVMVEYSSIEEMDAFADRFTWQHLGETFQNPRVLAMYCVAIRRRVLDECGGLDEGYAIGMFEDDDYAEAVRQAGYRLAIADDSFVHHFLSLSLGQIPSDSFKELFERNKARYNEKWNTEWTMHSYREGVSWENNGVIEVEQDGGKQPAGE